MPEYDEETKALIAGIECQLMPFIHQINFNSNHFITYMHQSLK